MAMLRFALLAVAMAGSAMAYGTKSETEVRMQEDRARQVAAKQAAAFHSQVAALNHNVIPVEEAQDRWHHQEVKKINGPVHWQWQVKSKTWKAVPKGYKHPKGSKAMTHEKAVKMQKAINKAVHERAQHAAVPVMKKQTAAEQAVAELESFEKINEQAFPTEKAHKSVSQTAEQMEKARDAEVDASMPARFRKQVGAQKQKAQKDVENGIMTAEERKIQKRLYGAKTYRKKQLAHEVLDHMEETAVQRNAAKRAGDAYLKHIQKLNDEVFPETSGEKEERLKEQKKAAAEAKAEKTAAKAKAAVVAEKKEALMKKRAAWKKHHDEVMAQRAAKAAAWKKHMAAIEEKREAAAKAKHAKKPQHNTHIHHVQHHNKAGLPPSSDAEPNPAGTDQVYLGAPQGGYAKGDSQHQAPSSKQQHHAKAH